MGFILWINHSLLDKWVVIIGLLVVPIFVYIALKDRKVESSKVKKIVFLIVIIHVGWLWWSTQKQPYDYAYIEKNNVITSSYVVHERQSWETPTTQDETLTSKYTLFRSVNSFLFIRESIHEEQRGLVNYMRWSGGKGVKIENHIYINTEYGNLLVK